jgi:hypothetical protein
MLSELAQKVTLYHLLHRIDLDLAAQVRARGCTHCGGELHSGAYVRKPRGGPVVPDEYCVRLSLCCASCRRRTLPPSVLFFGRRVYWSVVVLVVTTLRQRQGARTSRLRQLFGVTRQTVRRWVRWFRVAFPASSTWQSVRGHLCGPIDDSSLPGVVLERFVVSCPRPEDALLGCLRLLCVGLLPDGLFGGAR